MELHPRHVRITRLTSQDILNDALMMLIIGHTVPRTVHGLTSWLPCLGTRVIQT